MKTRITYLTIYAIVFPFLLVGQSSWSRVTPLPQENHINDLCKIPGTNKVIAIGEGSTVMISDDLGETWQLILNPGGLANHVPLKTIYFFNSTIGYIGGRYYDFGTSNYHTYILQTTDGGLTWIKNINLPGSGYQEINDFYFVDPSTGFALGYHGKLLKTTDEGESWFDIASGAGFTLGSIDFYNDSSGYIVGSSVDSVLKTTDYGNTWTKEIFYSPLTGGSLQEIQFTNSTTGYITQDFGDILKTNDAGESWNIIFTDDDINVYTIDFFDANHGIAGCYQDYIQSCIISTNNGGNTWSVITLPVFQENQYSVCCFDTNQCLFGGYQGSIYKSSNGGQSWEPKFNRDFWGNIIQVQNLDENTSFYLATNWLYPEIQNAILYKSENGGDTYEELISIAVTDKNLETEAAFHFVNEDIGYLTYYHYDNFLTVLKTTDGGLTWIETESGNFDNCPHSICFFDEQNGLIAGAEISGFILKTTDGGNTWIETYNAPYTYYMMDIHYFTQDHIIVSATAYWYSMLSNLIISEDAGNTWDELTLGSYGGIYDIEVNANTIYLACGDNVILKSPDGGNTWQFTQVNNTNNIEFHSIHFPTESIGFAVGSGNFEIAMKTTDGGETWEMMPTGTSTGLNAVHFDDENIGYIYGEKGLVLKTTNGGTTFINEPTEEKTKNHITSFPNPFVNSCTIQYSIPEGYGPYICEVIDQQGKQIIKKQLTGISGRIELKNEDLKPGIYMIILKNEIEILETQKIIKLN